MTSDENNAVKKVHIVYKNGNTLFANENEIYEIPIYQRAFAWGTESSADINRVDEVCQLMDDVFNFEENTYYIGSMVVQRKDINSGDDREKYEVIDGQQRLTALYIILSCLNWQLREGIIKSPFKELKMLSTTLTYSNRQKSQSAISYLDEVIKFKNGQESKIPKVKDEEKEKEEQWQAQLDEHIVYLEGSICDAVCRVLDWFDSKGVEYQKTLLDKLQKVILYRIEVPEDTDFNLYFEIMNVRGEQLEQTDIVKARLMQILDSDVKKEWFARTWNGCRDMTGYVQMNFSTSGNNARSILFGEDWNELPDAKRFEQLLNAEEEFPKGEDACDSTMLSAVLNPNAGFEYGKTDQNVDPEENSRFSSVIYFQYFLLHVLRIYKKVLEGGALETGQLKEKDIAGEFEKWLPKDIDKQAEWAWGFMICLLKCRCLFDRFFIKRDYINDESGDWCIMSLKKSTSNENSWQYQETEGKDKENKRCMMIESCLRVTYTDHKTMHWITRLLDWVYGKYQHGAVPISSVADKCEEFAKEEVKRDLQDMKAHSYRMGTRTSHLLFNYLDFLLWKEKDYLNNGNTNFAFEFRNSVEHWYPQHPTTIDAWEDGIVDGEQKLLDRDGFGNLCLIHASDNSRFSNLPPVSKSTYSPEMNEHGSLKYRRMVDEVKRVKTRTQNDITANKQWQEVSFKHGREMLELLAASIGGFELELKKYEWEGRDNTCEDHNAISQKTGEDC